MAQIYIYKGIENLHFYNFVGRKLYIPQYSPAFLHLQWPSLSTILQFLKAFFYILHWKFRPNLPPTKPQPPLTYGYFVNTWIHVLNSSFQLYVYEGQAQLIMRMVRCTDDKSRKRYDWDISLIQHIYHWYTNVAEVKGYHRFKLLQIYLSDLAGKKGMS